jgi:BirA family biotin operon repressor/biotin-[acetyl-CoA-carboxylase] ligase
MSLGVYDFINEVLEKPLDLAIKWPNDIYIGKKKLAGMLIENILKGSYLDKTIVGIGVNVNQEIFDPALPNPTSMFLYKKKKYDINEILFQLYAALERQYLRIQAGRSKEIISDYTTRLFQIGILAKYKITANQYIVEGVIEGVDDIGRLLLKINEELNAFDLKQISPVF